MQILLEKTLSQSEGKVADGMDISIVKVEKNKITYAGAMNPLYYIENGIFKEIKGDKKPIGGKSATLFSYQKHEIFPEKEITFYLLTDGFQDQFGQENKGKFMVKNLKKLLLEISEKSVTEQKQIIEKTFDSWKGKQKQTDDVLIIGLKI